MGRSRWRGSSSQYLLFSTRRVPDLPFVDQHEDDRSNQFGDPLLTTRRRMERIRLSKPSVGSNSFPRLEADPYIVKATLVGRQETFFGARVASN